MPRVVFTANLRRHVDCPELEVTGRSVAEVLESAFAVAPQVRGYVLDEQGQVRKHVAVYVDGRRLTDRVRLSDEVTPASEVWVLQALSGG